MFSLIIYCAAWAGAVIVAALGAPAVGIVLGLLMAGVFVHGHIKHGGRTRGT